VARSLVDGFEGYLTPSRSMVEKAVADGLIVLDTNVLLDLYTHEPQVRSTALEILQKFRKRLWLPHQVVREFWRNRLGRIAQATKRSDKVAEARQGVISLLSQMRPFGSPGDALDEVRSNLNQKFDEIEMILREARGEQLDANAMIADTSVDEVLSALTELFAGRVGEPFSREEESSLIAHAEERYAARVPPGYEDEHKLIDHAAGDFLLWEQTLRYLEASPKPSFVFVTQDSKADWRVQHPLSSKPLGAHPALVQEALVRANTRLFLLRPEEFYRIAGAILAIEAGRTESLADASAYQMDPRQVTWLQAAEVVMSEGPLGSWWSVEEMVDAISSAGLRDTSSAKTPNQTLRRDLNSYGQRRFVKDGPLYRLKREDELDQPPLI
jgi:rRNA-processing protein FCF1